jgi:hypothetical protein
MFRCEVVVTFGRRQEVHIDGIFSADGRVSIGPSRRWPRRLHRPTVMGAQTTVGDGVTPIDELPRAQFARISSRVEVVARSSTIARSQGRAFGAAAVAASVSMPQ